MFGKLMSSLGMQSPKIDTRIFTPDLRAGEMIEGEIILIGADSDKVINGVTLQLMTIAEVESGDHEFNQPLVLQQWPMAQRFDLPAKQQFQAPFKIQLPYETPITEVSCRKNSSRVWIHTHLDVDWGMDVADRDYLRVHPTPLIQAFFAAMNQCGLVLNTVDVEKGQLRARNFQSSIGCYQEFEFVPQSFGGLNEVEVSFVPEAHQTHVMIEVDRKFRGDQLKTLTLPNHNLNVAQIAQQIRQML